jgi:hypothetical protein
VLPGVDRSPVTRATASSEDRPVDLAPFAFSYSFTDSVCILWTRLQKRTVQNHFFLEGYFPLTSLIQSALRQSRVAADAL